MRKQFLKHRVLGQWAIVAVLALMGKALHGDTYGTNQWIGPGWWNTSWFNTENWNPHSVSCFYLCIVCSKKI